MKWPATCSAPGTTKEACVVISASALVFRMGGKYEGGGNRCRKCYKNLLTTAEGPTASKKSRFRMSMRGQPSRCIRASMMDCF